MSELSNEDSEGSGKRVEN